MKWVVDGLVWDGTGTQSSFTGNVCVFFLWWLLSFFMTQIWMYIAVLTNIPPDYHLMELPVNGTKLGNSWCGRCRVVDFPDTPVHSAAPVSHAALLMVIVRNSGAHQILNCSMIPVTYLSVAQLLFHSLIQRHAPVLIPYRSWLPAVWWLGTRVTELLWMCTQAWTSACF